MTDVGNRASREERDVADRDGSRVTVARGARGLDEPLRVAIVGAGRMARHHVRALSRLSVSNRIVLVYDPDPAQREELLELCPEASGQAELSTATLRDEADVVHVCSPPATHVAIARKALESGCHLYVEKPFASTRGEAEALLSLAEARGLRVCAGHQLLFEPPTQEALELTSKLGRLSHIESYFAFRPTRSKRGAGLSSDEQLKDVLPHPLYLLLRFLETADPDSTPEIRAVELSGDGTVHALIRSGDAVGSLVVTLGGRPVESYVKLVGSNGRLRADYVLGIVVRSIGPGTSAVDKVLQPFRTARQITFGTTASLVRRATHRGRNYPGLVEILDAFYRSIVDRVDPPLTDRHILQTVGLFEEIGSSIDAAAAPLEHSDGRFDDPDSTRAGGVIVTGGTGFLGREVVRNLLERGLPVRVVSRKVPPRWERLEGAEYVAADLGAGCEPSLLAGFEGVIHCAAETRGGWEDHRRNSIEATEHLLSAAEAAGVTRIVHVSSVAVLGEPARGERLSEETGLEPEDRRAGPYVWGKLNSEKVARRLGAELGLEVKVVRPGAIVDYKAFEPPGRLGRRFGNLFVAVGSRRERIAVVDLAFAARTLAWMFVHFQEAPDELNLLAPDLPTRRELVQRLKARNPDLGVLWLPGFALSMVSSLAVLGQKAIRRGREPIRLDRVFASERYDTSRIAALRPSIVAWPVKSSQMESMRGVGGR